MHLVWDLGSAAPRFGDLGQVTEAHDKEHSGNLCMEKPQLHRLAKSPGWHHTSSGNTFPSSGELFGGSPICWNHPCPHHRCFCRRFSIVVLLTLFSSPSQQQKNICYLLPRWFSAGLAKRIEQGKGEVSTRSGTQSTQLQGGEENKPGQC